MSSWPSPSGTPSREPSGEPSDRDIPTLPSVGSVVDPRHDTRHDDRPVVLSSGRARDRRTDRRSLDTARATADARRPRGLAARSGRWLAIAASAALVAASIAVAFWATSGGEGQTTALGPIPTDPPSAATSDASPGSSASTGSPGSTGASDSTTPADPSLIEVGQAVRFSLPEGYSRRAVGTGVEITNGRLHYYAQVDNRTPGEDPLIALQEYVSAFDGLYASVSYSQAIPRPSDTSGVTPADGYVVYYRVMAADGSGYKGVVDATRRADGLVTVTDLYTALDDRSGEVLPTSVAEELYASFLQTPAVGPAATLPPLVAARLTTVHPTYPLDGVVVVTPPVGWSADTAMAGRVALSHPRGQRFVAARLADTADPLVAQDQSLADLQAVWPGATLGPFTPSRDAGAVVSFDAGFVATAADGAPVEGLVRVWIDVSRSQVFHAVSSRVTGVAPEAGHEDFLMAALDISLTQPR